MTPTNVFFGNFYAGKRVLVTGDTGFKGSWLSRWLVELGGVVAGYANGIPTTPSLFRELALAGRIHHFEGDVRDGDSLKRAFSEFGPQVVFHLAAQPIVSISYQEPKLTFETNAMGTANVIEAIRVTDSVTVGVLITSDKCYENVEWEYGYRETDRLGGKDPYSASKACAEMIASAYMRSFFAGEGRCSLATARAGNVIGGGDWAQDRLVPDLFRAWAGGIPPKVRNPNSTRPWQHVLEPLSGYLWLGAMLGSGRPGIKGDAFNFGPDAASEYSVNDLVTLISSHLGAQWVLGDSSQANFDVREANLLRLNCERASSRLAWSPTLTYEDTIKLTCDWYRNYYRGSRSSDAITVEQIQFYACKALEKKKCWARTVGG